MAGKPRAKRNQASKIAANRRWNDKNQERLAVMLPLGRRALYHAAAKAEGLSYRQWVISALDNRAGYVEPPKEEEGKKIVYPIMEEICDVSPDQ